MSVQSLTTAFLPPANVGVLVGIYPRIQAALIRISSQVELWRARRQLLSMDAGLFKDAGVSPGNVDWLVRNGR